MTDLFASKRLTTRRGRDLLAQEKPALVDAVLALLTPKVVETLPEYFHGINNRPKALHWLQRTLAEGELLVVQLKARQQIIAFILLHSEERSTEETKTDTELHIGYLLAQPYWGKGYASEMLISLIEYFQDKKTISALNAGVAASNGASISLLEKCGFCRVKSHSKESLFYRFKL
ncbi:GNAT family N-acetyltransferase [Thalassomonas haliotis]|uniref:GNAT family N-acetyltransferase n=1 Tax=Thalassomonas haliotis TaxID=485448 RepID=A0ABY7VLC5_9GAMM|nr:GNAT family N-acetyltransferase [Thalassomonas haliotis]WDE14298.1 GNAT family N-acetyltransferase [Thalassomonas haliotis]